MDFPIVHDLGPDKFEEPGIFNVTEALDASACLSAMYGGWGDCYTPRDEILAVDTVFHLTKDSITTSSPYP